MTSHFAFAGGGGAGPFRILEESWESIHGERMKREHTLGWKLIPVADTEVRSRTEMTSVSDGGTASHVMMTPSPLTSHTQIVEFKECAKNKTQFFSPSSLYTKPASWKCARVMIFSSWIGVMSDSCASRGKLSSVSSIRVSPTAIADCCPTYNN